MRIDQPLPLLLAVVVGTLAVARVVRLIVDDEWPPVKRAREWYVDRASVDWQPLVECPWCVSVYFALPAVLWFASLFAWPGANWNEYLWWIVNGWMALSWIVAFLCLRDVPPDQRQ
ncbi:MAG TPA: hypothetical protein VIX41_11405 [Acidimicrobiales bacterium]